MRIEQLEKETENRLKRLLDEREALKKEIEAKEQDFFKKKTKIDKIYQENKEKRERIKKNQEIMKLQH